MLIFAFALASIVGIALFDRHTRAECCDRDTKFWWDEGENFRMFAAWNARERAAGSYSSKDWPRGSLATNRALLFAARQVLRNEWQLDSVIAAQRAGGGFAQLADSETNFWQQHIDYPPNININYIWPKWTGHVNTHFNTTEDGKVRQPFLIWDVPGCAKGDKFPKAGVWWAEIDETCQPVWYQRWTSDGAIELKLTEDSPVYRLVASDIMGDLSSASVYADDQLIYSVDITEYDPINLQMVVKILDHRKGSLITEVFSGNKDPWDTLVSHTIDEEPLSSPPTASGPCTFVVSTSGDDRNSGTLEAPWRTVGKAAASARAGDTVCFRAGTWNEALEPQNSGTASALITFTAFPGEEHRAVLDLEHMTGQKTYRGIVHIESKSYIIVENLTITQAEDFGVFVRLSDNVVIRNNIIDYTWNSGIFVVKSQNVIADGNDLQRVTHGQGGHPGHESISILGGTDGFEIKNNSIHNPFRDLESGEPVSKEGIDAKDGVANGKIYGNYVNLGNSIGVYIDAFDAYVNNVEIFNNELVGNSYGVVVASEQRGTVDGVSIYNNLIYDNSKFGIRIVGWVNGGWTKNIDVINNTIYANGDYGIDVSNVESMNIRIQNNISLGHLKQNLIVRPNIPADQVKTVSNLVEGDAQFVNAAEGDFHLLAESPAIDVASSEQAPPFDRDGVARPIGQAIDLGAYEGPALVRSIQHE